MKNSKRWTVSTHGKTLIAGGYILLEPGNQGLVAGLNSSVYCQAEVYPVVDLLDRFSISSDTYGVDGLFFQKASNGDFDVKLLVEDDSTWNTCTEIDGFAQACMCVFSKLLATASFKTMRHLTLFEKSVQQFSGHFLKLSFFMNDAFYHPSMPVTKLEHIPEDLRDLSVTDTCSVFSAPLKNIPKTGLGSSSAFVTCFVKVLLTVYFMDEMKDEKLLDAWTRQVSLLVHCLAQGKIGSGFDIVAALYGSILFESSSLDWVVKGTEIAAQGGSLYSYIEQSLHSIPVTKQICFPRWTSLALLSLPLERNVELASTSTTSFVTRVKGWLASSISDIAGTHAWQKSAVWSEWKKMHATCLDALLNYISFRSTINISEKDILCYIENNVAECDANTLLILDEHLARVRKASNNYRLWLRRVSIDSGIPILPAEVDKVLAPILQYKGVVMAGVAGAGGYDSFFVLLLHSRAKSFMKKFESVQITILHTDLLGG